MGIRPLPLSLLQFGMRIGVRYAFFHSDMLKYNSWKFAAKLFEDEHKVLLLDPTLAARFAILNELVFPVFLFLGLATRLATLLLLGIVFVIEVFVYPLAWPEHLMWASILAFLLTHGPGVLSLEHLIERQFAKKMR